MNNFKSPAGWHNNPDSLPEDITISESYKQLNIELHETQPTYGTSGWKQKDLVNKLVKQYNSKDVLDYGCGKSTLQEALSFQIAQYDPAIRMFSETPVPHDIVVCTDVLEHIEPELIDNFFQELQRVTKKVILMTIATRQACKFLADGRNAHLIVENHEWWMKKLNTVFNIKLIQASQREFTVFGTPKND